MKKKIIFLITFFISITNYYSYSQKKSTDTITFNSVFAGNIDKNTIAFKCTDFVVNAFTKSYKLKSLLKNHKKDLEVTKQPIPNIHDESVIDTIYHFSGRKNKISIYKAARAEFVNELDITDKKFTLYGNIHTGMSKDDFKKKFRLQDLKQDIVIISDEENMMKFNFIFKKNSLSKISFKAFID